MALWPFRRKSGRKRPLSGAALSDAEGSSARAHAEGAITRGASQKKQRIEPGPSSQPGRRYSFSPGRQDSLGTEKRRASPDRRARYSRQIDEHDLPPQPEWARTPTLHHNKQKKKSARGKNNRKKEERARAAEIKAISEFAPVRPAAEEWTSGRPMRKESKKFKAMPGFGVPRTSDVSIPVPGSIDSSMSSDSDYASFKVSALDSLAPRPTLRYEPGPRSSPSRTPHPGQSRFGLDIGPTRQPTLKGPKRIDELADDLDAGGLRELMEREDRRRERRRQKERERAGRKLARSAEKQKAELAEARKAGTPPPENLERGVAGRELVGLGIDPPSAVRTSSERRESISSSHRKSESSDLEKSEHPPRKSADSGAGPVEEPAPLENELVDKIEHEPILEPEPMVLDQAPLEDELKESAKDVPQEPPRQDLQPRESKAQESTVSLVQPSSRLGSLLRLRRSKSKSTVTSERDQVEEDSLRRSTASSGTRNRLSLTNFIRWGSKRLRKTPTPSSFSNTSRDEMQAAAAAAAAIRAQSIAQAQAEALARLQGQELPRTEPGSGVYISRKQGSLRTKSRFREDLPDYPSPPESPVQSPVQSPDLPVVAESTGDDTRTQPISIPGASDRQRPRSTSFDRVSSVPSPDANPVLSMSLASVDSEGSWLSGKVSTKRSSAMRESLLRANRITEAPFASSPTNTTQEDLAIADDDYLVRLTPNREPSGFNNLQGDGRPSSDDEDYIDESGAKWGNVGSHPQVVHKHRSTLRSVEGLLNIESEDEEVPAPPSPLSLEDVDSKSTPNAKASN
ncbi:unnamed protein product [Clonostachys rhizophaga]|uniref:Uncharacterized protein n=1 Tax=Clonostachys rhizophaga TaxID=160324 RepID=A0A9N9V2H1_9HYPO|nr:unnamed protein product [Clonostachys rhizophaga]